MKITPHNPVERYLASDFAQTELFQFLDALKAFLNEMDWDSFATKEELEVVSTKVDLLEEQLDDLAGDISEIRTDIVDLRGDIADIRSDLVTITNLITQIQTQITNVRAELLARIEALEAQMPNEPLDLVMYTFTNPDYFYSDGQNTEYFNLATTDNFVSVSITGSVLQDTDLTDGILEVINLTFDQNVNIDFSKTPNHFYSTMVVDYYDTNNNFVKSEIHPIDAEITQEMSAYDISVYFQGVLTGTNTNTKFHISFVFPYYVGNATTSESESDTEPTEDTVG